MKTMNLVLALALGAFGCNAMRAACCLPEQADPAGDRFRARRCGRLCGARHERCVREGARPAGGGRQQAGHRLEHRRGAGGQGSAGRLHAADREPEQHLGEPCAQSQAGVHAEGLDRPSPR